MKTFKEFLLEVYNTQLSDKQKKKGINISSSDEHLSMSHPSGVTFNSYRDGDKHHVSFDADEDAPKETRRRNALIARGMGKDFIERHPKGHTIEISPNSEKLRKIYQKHGFSDERPFMRLKR